MEITSWKDVLDGHLSKIAVIVIFSDNERVVCKPDSLIQSEVLSGLQV